MRVQGKPVERSYPPRALRQALLALVVSHAVVSMVLALLPFDDDWADDLGMMERVAGGGLWLFLFLAGPVVVVTFVVWAIIAWYASGARQLDAGWVMALAIGWLGVLPVAGEDGSLESVVLAAAACGQVGAWLFRRFVFHTSYTDAAADSP